MNDYYAGFSRQQRELFGVCILTSFTHCATSDTGSRAGKT